MPEKSKSLNKFPHTSHGILRYSPQLLGIQEKYWLVLDCDHQLGKYYRTLYKLFHHNCRQLSTPSWKEHITIIRNETPISNPHKWEAYNNQIVPFLYSNIMHHNDEYCWLNIHSPQLLNIRNELGLGTPEFPLHLTIGKL